MVYLIPCVGSCWAIVVSRATAIIITITITTRSQPRPSR